MTNSIYMQINGFIEVGNFIIRAGVAKGPNT
jgi:hypothetical protein